MKERIVIVGGGFGGLTAAVQLARLRKGENDCAVTVIDKNPHHLYYPLLYEVATGWFDMTKDVATRDFRHGEHELMRGSAVDFTDLRSLLAPHGIDLQDAEVTGLDVIGPRLELADGRSVPFDQLVIAVGGVPNTFGIEGLEKHAYMLYSMRAALAVRRRLHHLIEQRKRNEIPHIRIVIGGAGATGVEFACELGAFLKKLQHRGVIDDADWSIEMVEAGGRPLGGFHEDMSKWARKRIAHFGIKLLLDTCIKGVKEDRVVLAPRPLKEGEKPEDLLCDFRQENQKEVSHDLLVWTGGSKANPILETMNLPLDRRGRVEVDRSLQVRGLPRVWALGDCASLVDPKTERSLPPLAQAAIYEGMTVAKNIRARCAGGEPKARYDFPALHTLVPLGGSYGAAEVYGIRLKGRIVYPLKLASEARYFFRTFPAKIAWRMFRTAMTAYRKND